MPKFVMFGAEKNGEPEGNRGTEEGGACLETEERKSFRLFVCDDSWKLRSIVQHHGNSANFGHYTTYTRGNLDPFEVTKDDDEKRWYLHNDESVKEIKDNQIFTPETREGAYILYYELNEEDDDAEAEKNDNEENEEEDEESSKT